AAVALFARSPMLNLVAGACFAVFLLSALALRATERRALAGGWGRRAVGAGAVWRARAVGAFVAWFLLASFASGLSQRDLWPFAHWPIVSLVARPYIVIPKLVGVDAQGGEHDVDFRAMQPLGVGG